jgi:hypothetical protein
VATGVIAIPRKKAIVVGIKILSKFKYIPLEIGNALHFRSYTTFNKNLTHKLFFSINSNNKLGNL